MENQEQEIKKKDIYIKFNVDEVVDLAIKSLIYEVSISPKAGLVTKFSNGSHKDMTYETFKNSAYSLKDYFKNCFEHHKKYNIKKDEFFDNLRSIGKIAEEKMFEATAGVNTHKGTIFSMGILISVIAKYLNSTEKLNLTEISEEIKRICKSLNTELKTNREQTKGQQIYDKYKISGARGLALSGYSIVLNDGINKILEFKKILDLETSFILLLFYYISVLDDTNIISRSDIETLQDVKEKSKKLFIKNAENLSEKDIKKDMEELNKVFVQKNISPGGSADLLILTIFLYFLLEKRK